MAQVSTLTIGGNSYSVYALTADALDDANTYFAARLGADAWNDSPTRTRQQALVSAVRWLDRAVLWSGVRTDTVTPQPLEWPRDGANCDSTAIADGTVPDPLVEAQAEMALILLNDDTAQASTGTGSNVKKVKAGSAEVEFFTGTAGTNDETRLPTIANDLVGCLVEGATTVGGSYGTTEDDADVGYCKDDFDRGEPYP